MGRHRLHAAPPGGGKRRTLVRNGLLGVSVAVVLGTAAVTTGLVPVGDSFPYVGTDSASKTEAKASPTPDAGSSLQQQGGLTGLPGRAVPSAEASSASPTPSASPSPSVSASPSPTPSPSTKAPEPVKTTAAPKPAAPKPAAPKPAAPKPAAPKPVVPVPATGDGHSSEEAAVLALVNQERAQAGCGPVRANPPLASLAAAFSKDMAVRGFFDHTDPDGRTPWDRAQAAGISGLGGENIARGQGDAASVMNAWMNSPGHKANILNCEFRTLGVGAYFGAGGPWWTQDFGF
ncbi:MULTISPECIES: CAP domain-containing protein [unclassified Streptomyces]|uniref:CAP domain-containing protein n=1 Tax=unclassified Streptomyces TaxID=2593676 RepID=UPI002E30523C|nr:MULTISPECIES: CAP domain-containing protein [unclassified Streptomyces]WUC64442.1 CAP domain-containing protein [Streptomyces sp. NBC_00539]